jgi:hypothetical protein
MAATVTAAAVESTATAVEAATAAHCAAVESSADCYVRRAAVETANRAVSDVVVTVPSVAGSSPVARASVVAAMEPGACADEDAAGEVARTVITVRRARVRVIPIVAVSADGSRANIPRSHAYTHNNALGASVWRESQGSSKYCKNHKIFNEMFHFWAPSEPVKPFWLLLLFDAPGCFRWCLIVKHGRRWKVAVGRRGGKVREAWEIAA